MTEQLPELVLEDVRRLACKPGDVLVLRLASPTDQQTAVRLKDRVRRMVPGHEVLVLGPGVDLEVLEPQP